MAVRVLVVDDSALMRKMLTDILRGDTSIEVVGQARDGVDALEKVESLRPDVVTMDILMPVMDGFTALLEIMEHRPTPVVMVSVLTLPGAELTTRCLQNGAVDFVTKPKLATAVEIVKVGAEIIAKVKAAVAASPRRVTGAGSRIVPADTAPTRPRSVLSRLGLGVIIIGCSTGGPRALAELVPALPADIPLPIIIVQHMPAGLTKALAARLDRISRISVSEAADGDVLQVGHALIAPGGHHLKFDSMGRARLSDDPPMHCVRPSVDVTIISLVEIFGRRIVAALLTGMGKDGALGLKMVRDLGGATIAEDETTCTIYGMPRAAIEMGAAQRQLPLPRIADAITRDATTLTRSHPELSDVLS